MANLTRFDPFADPFKEIAQLVFDPLMEHREKA